MIYNKLKSLDKDPTLIQFAQTALGKIILLFAFVVPLFLLCSYWKEAMVMVIIITFIPQYRRFWLVVGMLYLLTQGTWFPQWGDWFKLALYFSILVKCVVILLIMLFFMR